MINILEETSLDGYNIFRIKKNDRYLYLGSKYKMKKYIDEIQKTIKKVSGLNDIVVFGSGAGVWLKELDKITENKRILIVEPEKEIFELLKNEEFNVKKNQIKAICMNDGDFYTNLISTTETSKITTIVFANYDYIYQKEFELFMNKIKDAIVDASVIENTGSIYAKVWFENYLNNLPYIIESNSIIKYKNMFKDKPVIIVSAGPSLDKNLAKLKNNEDKFLIIAVGRALKALNKENIRADFTAIIDGSDKMYEVFKDSLKSDVPLLFSELSSNKIVSEYEGSKICFSTREFYEIDKYLLDVEPIRLFQGGSVAHACIDFAKLLGSNTIIFIGQDLAFTDNKSHSNKALAHFENNKVQINTEYYVKGVNEDLVKTNFDFNIFRERIEMMIKLYNDVTFVNATEGGAYIHGTIEKSLEEVIDSYDEVIDKSILKQNFENVINKERVIRKLKGIYREIDTVISLCKEAIKINNNLLDLYIKGLSKYNKALIRLDEIDILMNQYKNVTHIFETMISAINNDIVRIFSSEEESSIITNNIKKVAERGVFLNKKLIEAFTYGKPLIKECIDKLEEM